MTNHKDLFEKKANQRYLSPLCFIASEWRLHLNSLHSITETVQVPEEKANKYCSPTFDAVPNTVSCLVHPVNVNQISKYVAFVAPICNPFTYENVLHHKSKQTTDPAFPSARRPFLVLVASPGCLYFSVVLYRGFLNSFVILRPRLFTLSAVEACERTFWLVPVSALKQRSLSVSPSS